MTKYICVQSIPETLEKGEAIVKVPDFVDDVVSCRTKMPSTGSFTPAYLRALGDYIGHKYDDKFPGAGIFVVNDYHGVPYKTHADVAKVVVKMFKKSYPKIFAQAIDHQIKHLPFGTKLVYFLGDFLDTEAFTRNGIDAVEEKDIPELMGRKPKGKVPPKKTEAVGE